MRMTLSLRLTFLLAVISFGIGAAAEAATLTGHVRDQAATPIANAVVDVLAATTNTVLASDTTAADGSYTITIADGNYDIRVTPPASSGLQPAIAIRVHVTDVTTVDFSLTAPSTTTFSGRVLDAAGAGIPSQSVQLIPEGGEIGLFATTDANGHFSFQTQPGSYFLVANGGNQGFSVQGPQFYSLQTAPFTISGSQAVDFPLPTKRVTVHVEDTGGNPVADVGLSSTNAFNCQLVFGPDVACGTSNYEFGNSTPASGRTDSAGNVTLYLFPSPSTLATTYNFTATPPAASGLANGSAMGVAVLDDTTVTIRLVPATVLTGRLLDGARAGIPFQALVLVPDGQESGFSATTDAAGAFSFALQPGVYRLGAFGDNQDFTASAPQFYSINSGPFSVSANVAIDFQLPVRRVDVHVQDSGGGAVANAGLTTSIVNNCALSFGPTTACGVSYFVYGGGANGATDADGNVTLWLFPTPTGGDPSLTEYRFTATPPSGSGLAPGSVSGIAFTSDTTVTMTLSVPATLSGRLVDGLGAGLPFQFLEFAPDGSGAPTDVSTDGNGNYSAQVAPGTYHINASGDNQNFTAASPQFYSINSGAFDVTSNQVINLALPVKRLDVHLQDAAGNPIANVGLSAFGPTSCGLTFGPSTACGNSSFFYTAPPPGSPAPATGVTDGSGNLTLWLFPTPPADPSGETTTPAYSLTATPLGDSGFDQTTVQGVTLTDDATLIIVLNAAHAAPVTTLSIDPAANADGTYPDPVTITLSATAADGFSIDATFYSVDGGEQQQYFGPFGITGSGPHSVRYFSSDSGGIVETAKTFNFTIKTPDTIAPTTTAVASPAPNGAGWNNSDVTVNLNAVDNPGGSGVQQITYSISGAQATPDTTVAGDAASIAITVEGVSTVTFFATDNAGNVEVAQSLTVSLDKTAPTIAVTVPVSSAIYSLGSSVAVVASCSDALSGIASCTAPAHLDTSSTGLKTLTVVATDNADNQTTKVVSYRVGGKDDCKNGGWRLFASPMFQNEGQCVSSFVKR